MKCVALLVALAFVVAVNADPDQHEHRITGQYVTHTHHYRITGKGGNYGGGNGGAGGKPSGGGKGGKGGKGSNCQSTGITGAANSLNKGLQNTANKLGKGLGANKKNPGLLGRAAGGLETAFDHVAGGANQAVSDFFCGFNRVFNKVGSKAGKGDLLGGVVSGAKTFATGAGSFFFNGGKNALQAATSGVSDVANGRRGKKGIVHDRSRRG